MYTDDWPFLFNNVVGTLLLITCGIIVYATETLSRRNANWGAVSHSMPVTGMESSVGTTTAVFSQNAATNKRRKKCLK